MTILDMQDAASERIVKAIGIIELLRVSDGRAVYPEAAANACWAIIDLLQDAKAIIQRGASA